MTKFEAVLLQTERHMQIDRRTRVLEYLQNAINVDYGCSAIKLKLIRPDHVLIQNGHAKRRLIHIEGLSEMDMIRVITALIP